MRALLVSTALTLSLICAPISAAQDYEAMAANMEQSMALAQAQAVREGDDALTCEQLEIEIAANMQDPAVQAAIAANGADAQAQLDRANAARGQMRTQMGVGLFMGLASSFVPGLGYAQMAQQQMMAGQQQRQAQQNMAQAALMGERMAAIMPQMMRGQRVYELGQAKQCAFVQPPPQ
jgi:hypothetical protein